MVSVNRQSHGMLEGGCMDYMTDKQMEFIVNLVADKITACKDMDEVKKAVEELKIMVKKEPK